MVKKIMLVFLSVMMSVCLMSSKVSAAINGQCGDDVYWVLDGNILTISGEGGINDYSMFTEYCPWYAQRNDIKEVIIQNGVTKIGNDAFRNCESLTSITIPGSVRKIGNYAFENCESLTSITLPNSITTIGDCAFFGSSLKSVVIPGSVTDSWISAFAQCSSLTDVTILDGVTCIDESAFFNCRALTKVIIPESVRTIKNSAFSFCVSLKKITIPNNVTSLGDYAFYGNSDLSIYFEGDAPEMLDNLFSMSNVKAYYPKGNSTWTEEKFQNYGASKIEWIAYDPTYPFTDVSEKQWYRGVVKEAYDLGLMTGATETLFKPNANMNRAMVAIVFHRMEGSKKVEYSKVFPDVAKNEYYTTSVLWAKQKGVINGYNDGTFKPLKNVTREEMATMIYNFAKYKGLNVKASKNITGYKDYHKITTYARAPLQWAVEKGLMSGKDNGTRLDPLGTATRAECSKMLVQAYKVIYK